MSMYLNKKLFYILRSFADLYSGMDYENEAEFRETFHDYLVEHGVNAEDQEQLIEEFIKIMPYKSWEH